jgi:hypothetical protein
MSIYFMPMWNEVEWFWNCVIPSLCAKQPYLFLISFKTYSKRHEVKTNICIHLTNFHIKYEMREREREREMHIYPIFKKIIPVIIA